MENILFACFSFFTLASTAPVHVPNTEKNIHLFLIKEISAKDHDPFRLLPYCDITTEKLA